MSEPDKPFDKDLEALLRGEDELARLYRETRTHEAVPDSLDQKIIGLAQEEARRPIARRPRWIQPLAVAATLVLSLGVLINIWRDPVMRDQSLPQQAQDQSHTAEATRRQALPETRPAEEAVLRQPEAAESLEDDLPAGRRASASDVEAGGAPLPDAGKSVPGSRSTADQTDIFAKPWASASERFVPDPPPGPAEPAAGGALPGAASGASQASTAEPPPRAEADERIRIAPEQEARERRLLAEETQKKLEAERQAQQQRQLQEQQRRSEQQRQAERRMRSAPQSADSLQGSAAANELRSAAPATTTTPPSPVRPAPAAELSRVPSVKPSQAPTLEQQFETIRKLIRQGNHTDALNLMHLLRIENPGIELPADLKSYLSGAGLSGGDSR